MEDIFKKLFKVGAKKPNSKVVNSLNSFFPNAVNVEWTRSNTEWEALLHDGDMECIVKFGDGGDVLETRRNYTLDRLTQTINSLVPKGDELMNVIEISKKGVLKYEFIMRDGDLNRFVVLVNDEGVVERRAAL